MDFPIRRLEKGDLEALSALATETFVETYSAIEPLEALEIFCQNHYSTAALGEAMRDAEQAFFGLFESQNAAAMGGFLHLIFGKNERGEPSETDCNLRRVYLLQKLKGQKLGKELMETALFEAKKRQKQRLWLVVYNQNFAAQAFYRHIGMRECGEFEFDFNGSVHRDFVFETSV